MIWVSVCILALFGIFYSLRLKSTINKKTATPPSRQERKTVSIPMVIEAPYNQAFSVSSYDISMGGAFIRFDDMNQSMNKTALFGKRAGIKVGDHLRIQVFVSRFQKISCSGKVARIEANAKGKYPDGLGIQFLNPSKKVTRQLYQLLHGSKKFGKAS